MATLYVITEFVELSDAFWFVLGYSSIMSAMAAAIRSELPNRLGLPAKNLAFWIFFISFFSLSFYWLMFVHPLWLFIGIPLIIIFLKVVFHLIRVVRSLF